MGQKFYFEKWKKKKNYIRNFDKIRDKKKQLSQLLKYNNSYFLDILNNIFFCIV